MRASPYDLEPWDGDRGFDLSPVRIETEAGRRQYQKIQADLARRAAPLRVRLLSQYEHAASCWE
eukprot:3474889-Prymnesium_polylepis.1